MCYVYVISSDSAIKIGVTTNIQSRLASLQTANPEPLTVACAIRCVDESAAHALEKHLHNRYRAFKLKGEWFDIPPHFVTGDIQFALNVLGLIESVQYQTIKEDKKRTTKQVRYTPEIIILVMVTLILSCNLFAGSALPLWVILILGFQGIVAVYNLRFSL